MEKQYIAELKNISKSFPGVKALNDVSLNFEKGSVHGIVGENGAGKSTLIKIIAGVYQNYTGKLFVKGKQVLFKSEKDAFNAGISVVAQELNPIPDLTVAESIYLGCEPMKGIFIDKKKRDELARHSLKLMNLDIPTSTKIRKLSIAQTQLIEITKAISKNAEIVIMDEPTSALNTLETERLFEQIDLLKDKGITVIYISHRLEEVFRICDTISVLRDGEHVGSNKKDALDIDTVISMMVGREIGDIYPQKSRVDSDTEILRVDHLTKKNTFEDISFYIRKGEVLGFAGMMGAGRSEIARAVFGLDAYDSGTIMYFGKETKNITPRNSIELGTGMVTEDRRDYGFVEMLSIKDNIAIPNMDFLSRLMFLKRRKMNESAQTVSKRLQIKAPGVDTLVNTLSGGNQQKVVIAKWMVRNLKLLILDEPTRGIDVGAKQEIYDFIVELAAQGMAILLISSELNEVIALSHRIMVISKGRIVGELSGENATQNAIMERIIRGGARKNG